MKIDILTTFPNIFDSYMNESMMKIAINKGILEFNTYNIRDWTHDAHRTTDDYIYGGGCGLLMKPEPIFEAFDDLYKETKPYVVIASPHGKKFTDVDALFLSKQTHLCFICGHYEGLDERIYSLSDKIVSIGDYVLTSGELATQVIIDASVRKIDGVLGAKEGASEESFANILLEHAQYTRPSEYRGMKVPAILLEGNESKIDEFNRRSSLERTWNNRPDLIEIALRKNLLTDRDLELLESIKSNKKSNK